MKKKILIDKKRVGKYFDASRGIFTEMINVNMSNPLTFTMHLGKNINEGLVMTYPYKVMKRYIMEYFNIPSFIFHDESKQGGVDACAIDIPKGNEKLYQSVENAMNLCGYFKSIEGEFDDFKRVHFEPKFEENKDIGNFLYHLTYHLNEPKIRKIGLCPRSKNRVFNYPERIYFLTSNATTEEIKSLARMLYMTHNKPAIKNSNVGMYVILKINTDKLPQDVKFYNDPNLSNSVYTTDNIPPDAIVPGGEVVTI